MSDLPNIGKELSTRLSKAGITTIPQLLKIGSRNAFARLYTIDDSACLDMLYALEGATRGIRWHNLPASGKKELKLFMDSLKQKSKPHVKEQ